MNHKLRNSVHTVLAVGAALAASNAYALKPGDYNTTERANNVLRFSGATATDTTVENGFRLGTGGLCQAGTVDIYRSGASTGGAQYAVLCTGRTGVTGLAGVDYVFKKESEFGSASGSSFVASATPVPIDFLDVFNTNFACAGDDNIAGNNSLGEITFVGGVVANNNPKALSTSGNLIAGNEYTNCTPQAQFPATAGISDVEAKLLGGDGGQGLATSQFQILFGVPVSLNLYRALQVAQGITVQAACDTQAEMDTENCVPSLSSDVIRGLQSGSIADWTQILRSDTGSVGDDLTTVDIPGAAGLITDTAVYVCRRGNTSGTQIGTRANFLNQGCGGSVAFVSPDDSLTEANGEPYNSPEDDDVIVFAGDASADVRNCLDARDDQNRWAIGVLSTDSAVDGTFVLKAGGSGTTTTGNIGGDGGTAQDSDRTGGVEGREREFRFVRVDGFLPSLEVAANGGYTFYTENVCTERSGSLTGGSVPKILYSNICGPNGLSALAKIAAGNLSFDNQPWGDGGNMGIPYFGPNVPNTSGTTLAITQAQMVSNPVNSTTRSPGGTANNCSTPTGVNAATLQKPSVGPNP